MQKKTAFFYLFQIYRKAVGVGALDDPRKLKKLIFKGKNGIINIIVTLILKEATYMEIKRQIKENEIYYPNKKEMSKKIKKMSSFSLLLYMMLTNNPSYGIDLKDYPEDLPVLGGLVDSRKFYRPRASAVVIIIAITALILTITYASMLYKVNKRLKNNSNTEEIEEPKENQEEKKTVDDNAVKKKIKTKLIISSVILIFSVCLYAILQIINCNQNLIC